MTEPQRPRFRRRNYYVKRPFQRSFTLRFVFLLAVEAVLIAGLFFYNSRGTLTTGYHGYQIRVDHTSTYFFTTMLGISLAAAIAMALVGMALFILFSHRIAGPILRLEKSLQEIRRGDLTHRIRLRRKDELVDVAGEINRLTEELEASVRKMKRRVDEASKLLSAPEKPGAIDDCRRAVQALKEITDSFKTS